LAHAKLHNFYLKNNRSKKRVGDVAQTVVCLPSKSKALISNPSTNKKRKDREGRGGGGGGEGGGEPN
jgi:hypothetical protein